jgi:hypothetical protein
LENQRLDFTEQHLTTDIYSSTDKFLHYLQAACVEAPVGVEEVGKDTGRRVYKLGYADLREVRALSQISHNP